MTQFQYDLISKIIQNGAPALANELCGSLDDIVLENRRLLDEIEMLKHPQADLEGETSK